MSHFSGWSDGTLVVLRLFSIYLWWRKLLPRALKNHGFDCMPSAVVAWAQAFLARSSICSNNQLRVSEQLSADVYFFSITHNFRGLFGIARMPMLAMVHYMSVPRTSIYLSYHVGMEVHHNQWPFGHFFASNVQGNQKGCTRSYKPLHPLKCTCICCSLTEYSPVFPNQPLTTIEPFLDSKTWHQDQRLWCSSLLRSYLENFKCTLTRLYVNTTDYS